MTATAINLISHPMSIPLTPVPGPEPEDFESAEAVPEEAANDELPMSEVARRLSVLGKLIVPRAPQ